MSAVKWWEGKGFVSSEGAALDSLATFGPERPLDSNVTEPAEKAGAAVLLLVQKKEELPAKIPVGNAASTESAVLECLFESDARDAADAQSCLDRALDRLGVLKRERDVKLRKNSPHRSIERLPGA